MPSLEHTIRRLQEELKQKVKEITRMMNEPYSGTLEEFQTELMLTTGLANFAMLWDPKRKRPRIDY